MIVYRLFSLLLSAGLVLFVFTQIVWPSIMDRPTFPWFKERLRKARERQEEAAMRKREAELDDEATGVAKMAQEIADDIDAEILADLLGESPKSKEESSDEDRGTAEQSKKVDETGAGVHPTDPGDLDPTRDGSDGGRG
jgi:hypothetical protein